MEMRIKDGEDVWAADDYKLGVARALHYRPPEAVNAEEQLYGVYLEVVSYELGDDLYIPIDFLTAREEGNERLALRVPLKFVMQRAWSRAPDFVAKRLGREVLLRDMVDEEGAREG